MAPSGRLCHQSPDEYDDRGVVTVKIECDKNDLGYLKISQAEVVDWTTNCEPEIDDFCRNWYRPDRLCSP